MSAPNAGKAWTDDEVRRMKLWWEAGEKQSDIAKYLGRTYGAITAALERAYGYGYLDYRGVSVAPPPIHRQTDPSTEITMPVNQYTDVLNLKIEDVKQLNGRDVTEINDESIINMISELQAHDKRLTEINLTAQSARISSQLNQIASNIDQLVAILDARETSELAKS